MATASLMYALFFGLISSTNANIIDCSSSTNCYSTSQTCTAGETCNINCVGNPGYIASDTSYQYCGQAIFNCADGYDCTFTCSGSYPAYGVTINCPDNANCYINIVEGEDWYCMRSSTINGGSGGNLIVTSNQKDPLYLSNINCPTNGDCNFTASSSLQNYRALNIYSTASTRILHIVTTTISNPLGSASIYCPSWYAKTTGMNNCIIDVSNGYQMLRSTNIYAYDSFNDVNVSCDWSSRTDAVIGCYFDLENRPIMHCGSTSTCTMELIRDYNVWGCTDTNSACHRTLPPTKNPTTNPTAIPTVTPSNTPTKFPTMNPFKNPTHTSSTPTKFPTRNPTTDNSTLNLSVYPLSTSSPSLTSSSLSTSTGTLSISEEVDKDQTSTRKIVAFHIVIGIMIGVVVMAFCNIIAVIIYQKNKQKPSAINQDSMNFKKCSMEENQHIHIVNQMDDNEISDDYDDEKLPCPQQKTLSIEGYRKKEIPLDEMKTFINDEICEDILKNPLNAMDSDLSDGMYDNVLPAVTTSTATNYIE